MNRFSSVALVVLLAPFGSFGQTTSAPTPAQAAAAKVIGQGAFPVKVTKTLDSSKLKDGDAVEAETAGGFKLADGNLVPKGSKLMGHVVASKARSKGDGESELTIAFDKLSVGSGEQLSVRGMVQAVFPPSDNEDPGANAMPTAAAGGSAGRGGFSGAAGAGVGVVTGGKSGSSMESSAKAQPAMNPKSTGVQGIHDLQLSDGVLSSKGKSVKLGSGVRMIVRVDILG
jgi:hypothetical protein